MSVAPTPPASRRGSELITAKRVERLDAGFANDAHVEVEITWAVYQRMIGAYREPDRRRGRQLTVSLGPIVETQFL